MTVALITSRRSTQYNADPPRANIVAILILLGSIAIGILWAMIVGTSGWSFTISSIENGAQKASSSALMITAIP